MADLLPSERLAALSLDRATPSRSTASPDHQQKQVSTDKPLSALFQEAQALVARLDDSIPCPCPYFSSSSSSSSASSSEADDLQKGLALLYEISKKVHGLGLLSSNEKVDDVATADLKYVLVDFYLGVLHGKVPMEGGRVGGGGDARRRGIEREKRHWEAFMLMCEGLGFLKGEDKRAWEAERRMEEEEGDEEEEEEEGGHDNDRRRRAVLPTSKGSIGEGGMDAGMQRALKIERFRRERTGKERLRELNYLHDKLQQRKRGRKRGEDGDEEEEEEGELEEVERERTKLWIEMGARKVLDEWPMLRQETKLLSMMQRVVGGGGVGVGERGEGRGDTRQRPGQNGRACSSSSGMQVTHIDKGGPGGQLRIRQEELRARVFQPGYSLPTVSLEEFAAQEVAAAEEREAKAKLAAEAPAGPRRYKQLEEEGKEDEAELVEKAAFHDRAWDDWKDANPRGSGNKMGKRF